MFIFRVVGILSILKFFFFFVAPTSAADTPITPDSVLVDYPKFLAKLEEQYKHCYGEAIYTISSKSKEGVIKLNGSSKVDFAFSGQNGMIKQSAENLTHSSSESNIPQEKPKTERDYQSILNYSDNYSFKLAKKSPDSNFSIRWLTNGPATAVKEIMRGPGHFVGCSYTADLFPIMKLFVLPGFKIDQVSVSSEKLPYSRVQIEFTIPKRKLKSATAIQVISGWFVVAPERSWVLLKYGLVFSSSNSGLSTRIGHIEYDGSSHDNLKLVLIRHFVYDGEQLANSPVIDSPTNAQVIEEFRFTKFIFGDRSAREFTLSGFGLPEFGQTVAQIESSRAYPWWILGLAIGLTFVALFLRRLSARDNVRL